jgi:hypothetical protein
MFIQFWNSSSFLLYFFFLKHWLIEISIICEISSAICL